MARTPHTGPRMPKIMSAAIEAAGQPRSAAKKTQSRVERRKEERLQKKSMRSQPRVKPRTSLSRRPTQVAAEKSNNSKVSEVHSESDEEVQVRSEASSDVDDSAESASEVEDAVTTTQAKVSKTTRSRLEQDDAEIEALERKLGIKRKKGKKDDIFDDGLEDLFGDLGEFEDGEEEEHRPKRKSAADEEWLSQKRRKVQLEVQPAIRPQTRPKKQADTLDFDGFSDSDYEDFDDDGNGQEENDDGDAELLSTSEESTPATDLAEDAEEHEIGPSKPVRENPYVAPTSADATPAPVGKYIPPSMRRATSSEDESVLRLNRSIKGLINRLSESNLLSILSSLEALYLNNARQNVTSGLINTLLALVTESSVLSDLFIVLHGALIAALYRVVGVDFGAQLLERIVVILDDPSSSEAQKPVNLVSLLAIMYSFSVISCDIIYDLIRDYTKRFTEDDTEMLLRIVRLCGPQLRQDDASALKDVVTMLKSSVAERGAANLSVRQSFMVETITDLKNNRLKSGMATSVGRMESTTRMKKLLGSVKSKATRASEPLRVSLGDIRDTEKKGKWWLVGASYHDPAKMAAVHQPENNDVGVRVESSTVSDHGKPEVTFQELARELGMNTDIRKRIFMAIMTAEDYKHGTLQIQKLALKKNQMKEIPAVLVRCVIAEKTYNPYYGTLAKELCSKHHLRPVRVGLQFALWDQCQRLDDDVEEDSSDGSDRLEIPQLTALAKFYAKLIRSEALPITILKKFDFAYLKPRTRLFLEALVVFIIIDKSKSYDDGPSVETILAGVKEVDDMVLGFRYFLQNAVAKTEIPEKKRQVRMVAEVCARVDVSLSQSAQ